MSESAAERARRRVREEMAKGHLSQSDVAGQLKWTQSRISKVLSGKTDLGVNDLEAICFAVGLRITEAVRDQGLEFCAEMTPTEMRIVQEIRTLTPDELHAFLVIFGIHQRSIEARGATKRKPIFPPLRTKSTG